MTIRTDLEQEEAVTTLDEEITFEDLCDHLDAKIDNWKDYYVLVDKDSKAATTAVKKDAPVAPLKYPPCQPQMYDKMSDDASQYW